MWDQLQRFVFEECEARGVLLRMKHSLQRNVEAHAYPPTLKPLLGEALLAVTALSSTIKIKGRVSLQLKGEQDLRLLVAECNDNLGVRAMAQWQTSWSEQSFQQLVDRGLLAINLLPDQGQHYQGMVPLQGAGLSDCIENYFAQSEQLSTALILCCDGKQGAALLIQALPGAKADDMERLIVLAKTVQAHELFTLESEQILHRLFHQESVRLFDAQPVQFACRCSRERSLSNLRLLSSEELQMIVQEQGKVSVSCEFCNRHYDFDEVDIKTLSTPDLLTPNTGNTRH